MSTELSFVERHLTLWRLKFLRIRCLLGIHQWVQVGEDQWFCDGCPLDKWVEDGKTYTSVSYIGYY